MQHNMAEHAVFSLKNYFFDEVVLNLHSIKPESAIDMNFSPSGNYDQEKGLFTLQFSFDGSSEGINVIHVNCVAFFEFNEPVPFGELPDFFYGNCIAILFPYVRSMVSTLTLQANINPMILPTLNLISLKDILKANTTVNSQSQDV